MKFIISVPFELYRCVEAKAATLGRSISEVTAELLEKWVNEKPAAPEQPPSSNQP